jgi:uncharacterized protein (DUF983 family)
MAIQVRALARGMLERCPRCGAKGLFRSFFGLRDSCPGCGFGFVREEGYWLGAMIVVMALTEALFALWLVGGLLLTWPDVPWTLLLVGGIVLNIVVPIVAYPWSKTTWLGLHLAFVPLDAAEEAAAITAHAAAARTSGRTGSDASTEGPHGPEGSEHPGG